MNSENREIMPGETMFEYLKRKKRFILEKTVNSNKTATTRQPLQQRTLNQSFDNDKTKRDDPNERAKRDELRDYSSSRCTVKDKNETTIRRPIIQETRKPMHRSFIQMISPIRSKSPAREIDKSISKEPSLKKDRENFTKKMLTQKINLMRETIESQLKAGRSLKEKAHLLFLDLKPFFRHLDNCGESTFEKKTQEIKAKIRAMESVFKEFNTQAHHSTIDQFYMHFSQYLNELEGQAKAEIEENKDSLTSEISTAKNREIYDLKDQNTRLQKELALLTKRYAKLQNSYDEALNQTELKLTDKQQRYEQKIHSLQDELMQSRQKVEALAKQVQMLTAANMQYEQERKKMISQRQRFEQECLNTITRVKSEQEEFLLNEIVVIKKEFSLDISKMAELYKIKEEDLLRRIKEEQLETEKVKKIVQELVESNKKLDESLIAVQAQSIRIKKQNEYLSTDMHRINEELYQHWLALKDIKTLSQRLDIFQKFRKIYEELLFNQQLFL